MVRRSVNMMNFVPSHILRENSLLSLLRNSNQIWISISFISKQYGVLIEKMIMREMFVFMLTTGKITEESPQFSITQRICVKIGIQKISLLRIKMVANLSINAASVMAGRSRNSTLTISK
jgi:hypothetical protein